MVPLRQRQQHLAHQHRETRNPNILFIVSDDTGYGDHGPYGGGAGRGMPTPNIDKLAASGMTFFSYYASDGYTGPIRITDYQRFQYVREMLQKEGLDVPLPTGN